MIHKNIFISGRVQGVGFRYSAKDMANVCGIKGFVKNMYDGSVYIEAEGSEPSITKFIKWCYKGPSHAHVENVSVIDGEVEGFKYFEIRH